MSARGSWRGALAHGAQWRYFALFAGTMGLPTLLSFAPIDDFLRSLLDNAPRHGELVRALDSHALVDVLRQLADPAGERARSGVLTALVAAVVVAPALAGAAAALARKSGRSDVKTLLGGAGELFPRMLRMLLASCIPFGVAFGGAAAAYHFADKAGSAAVLESSATHATLAARTASLVLLWLAGVTVEAGRAYFAAEADRKSALVAWWSGVRLVVRHPAEVFGLCIVTTAIGLGSALVLSALRFRIVQAGAGSIALAFAVAQLAVVAIAWGRSTRLSGLVALIRAEDKG